MERISKVKLELIIYRELLHKTTDERTVTLDAIYQTLSKEGYFKSILGFKNGLIDIIDGDCSGIPEAERLKEDVEYWYQETDVKRNASNANSNTTKNDRAEITINNDNSGHLTDLADALSLNYSVFLNRVKNADFANIEGLSKNRVCGIILYIQQYYKTNKEWKHAAANSIGYSTNYVSKKTVPHAKINELVDDHKNKNKRTDLNKLG